MTQPHPLSANQREGITVSGLPLRPRPFQALGKLTLGQLVSMATPDGLPRQEKASGSSRVSWSGGPSATSKADI